MIFGLLAVVAAAAPTAKWEAGVTHNYEFGATLQTPLPMKVGGGRTALVRIGSIQLRGELACASTGELPKGRGWTVKCDIDKSAVEVAAVPQDEKVKEPAVAAMVDLMNRAQITFEQGPGGRLSKVRFEGVDLSAEADDETVNLLSKSAKMIVAPLDWTLPSVDGMPGWPHKSFIAADFPMSGDVNALASTKIEVGLGEGTETHHVYMMSGRGSIGLEQAGGAQIEIKGTSAWDKAGGFVTEGSTLLSTTGLTGAIATASPFVVESRIRLKAPATP